MSVEGKRAKNGNFQYEIEYPIIGSVSGFGGKKEDTFTYYTLSSYNTPSMIYRYDVINNKSEFYKKSKIDFDGTQYETKQVFYTSKDGTLVPMFIVHKKGLELNPYSATSSFPPSFKRPFQPELMNRNL